MHRTLDDVRQEGLDALVQRLGRADMIRFLQQFETGEGDYARQRREWVESTTLEEIESLRNVNVENSPRASSTRAPRTGAGPVSDK